MRTVFRVNHVLVVLFALSSGLFKVAGGRADIELFAHIGMSAAAVAVFGVIQALGGFLAMWRFTARFGAAIVTVCNAFATVGLFLAGVQPFGAISVLFIVMAFAAMVRGRSEPRVDAPARGTTAATTGDHGDPRIGAARADARFAQVRTARDPA